MGEKITSFRDLVIWKNGIVLVEKIYQVTKNFPSSEQYGLSSQMRRASVSVPSNIAEGFRRKHVKEYQQFLSIALGSLGELETHIEICRRLNYLAPDVYLAFIADIDVLCRMTQALLKKLRGS